MTTKIGLIVERSMLRHRPAAMALSADADQLLRAVASLGSALLKCSQFRREFRQRFPQDERLDAAIASALSPFGKTPDEIDATMAALQEHLRHTI